MKRVLLKLTILATFEPQDLKHAGVAETLGDAAAELLRHDGALTAAADYDFVTVTVPDAAADDSDVLGELLTKQYPDDGLTIGDLAPVHMLGRNGMFRKARLVRVPGRLQVWLGFDDERFPLLEFYDAPKSSAV